MRFAGDLAAANSVSSRSRSRRPRVVAGVRNHRRSCRGRGARRGQLAGILKILISNDDGYLATGLEVLAAAISEIAEVVVVAPDRNRSGASNSLTLQTPLRVTQTGDDVYCVNGTPSDCVHLALSGLFEDEFDMVISGINDGANLGDDVIYSGTVAAAMEGRFLGRPAIAVSLAGRELEHFEAAARITRELVERLLARPLSKDHILNVNVPDVPYEALGGFAVTRLGFRHRSEPVIPARDPKGRRIYWIGAAGEGQDAGPGTDFDAVASGRVSVTPLKIDLTRHETLGDLETWLAE